MSDITNHTRHVPSIIEIQRLDVETIDSSTGRYFVHLRLAGNDLWVQGTPVWHNRMSLPDCLIRNVVSGGIFEAGLSITHWRKPYKIWIFLPQITEAVALERQQGPWNFIGFAQKELVDIEFVKSDAERLKKEEELEELAGVKVLRPEKRRIV